MAKLSKRAQEIAARRAADPIAQAVERTDIDYSTDELPTAPRELPSLIAAVAAVINEFHCPEDGTPLVKLYEPEPSSWGDYWKCARCGNRYQRAYTDHMSGNQSNYTVSAYRRPFEFEKETN